MPSVDQQPPHGKAYWRSLDELADTPAFREFLHREFPAGAADLIDSGQRRQFLKIMGASLALAGLGLGGCRRWPKEKITPFAHRPPGRVPGLPLHYATSMELGGVASGLLVTSYDGRPIKVEGNPEHPTSRGATDALAQASVLGLYDPDRSRNLMTVAGGQRTTSSWRAFDEWAGKEFQRLADANAKGAGLAVLSEATSSPSVNDLKRRLLARLPRATWHEYEPINNDHELAGSTGVFGSPHRTHYAFERAKIIVSLDSDFLHIHPAAVKHTRDFAATRRADDPQRTMSRLYVFEPGYSLTGANADHRFPVRGADVGIVLGLIAKRLMGELRPSSSIAQQRFEQTTPADVGVEQAAFDRMIEDLDSHRGESLVVAGRRQPAEVHALTHAINEHLGNFGSTVSFSTLPDAQAHLASITDLVNNMAAGAVETLVMLGGNPVYDAPADLEFAHHLGRVPTSIHLSLYDDETSKRSTWHLPRAHYLESWSDARAFDGTLGVVQPIIAPLFGGRTPIELLATISADRLSEGQAIVRRTFASLGRFPDVDRSWKRTLHEGFLAASPSARQPKIRRKGLGDFVGDIWQRWPGPESEGFELAFAPDASVYDGRFANNGWLQELPDPLTKLTWDNAVLMSPRAARELGVTTGDMVTLTHQGRSVKAAVCVMPGQHARSVTLALGYGRRDIGVIAQDAGFDFYPLRTTDAMGFALGAVIEPTGATYELAQTQDHHALDTISGRGAQERLPSIFREATRQEYLDKPGFANDHHHTGAHVVHRLSLWDENTVQGAQYRWGMSIDLNACTGCSACMVACQAENNIPIVGKDQVKRGRELHWIRVDRYFKGNDPERPEAIALQPVPCMMCENAPCEQVCPVAATTHDADGLNVMIYNRCIGTRYCSNNCPYKVRRFNYFDYHKREPVREGGALHVTADYYTRPQTDTHPLKQMQFNPEVTVRSRGVMEKCTYCIQRISAAKITAKNAWMKLSDDQKREDLRVTIPDGSLTTACAQACPAGAIVFGDLGDPGSSVAALRGHERSYEMLEELNTKPRTTYLAKLRNPIPDLIASPNPRTPDDHTGA